MEFLELFDTVELDEFIMIILTIIIACSAYSQARNTKKQAQLLKEAEERNTESRIILTSYNKYNNGTRYVGFSIKNESFFEVTITSFDLELGIPEDSNRLDAPIVIISPITESEDGELPDSTLPRRFGYGDSMQILYNETEVVEMLRVEENDQPARVRPRCYDSLGNKYTMNHWITWEKSYTAMFDEPGPGYLTEEERYRRLTSKGQLKRLLRSSIKKTRSFLGLKSRY